MTSDAVPRSQCAGAPSQLQLCLVSAAAPETEQDGPSASIRLATLAALCGRITQLWGPTPRVTTKLWELVARRLLKPQPTAGRRSLLMLANTVP